MHKRKHQFSSDNRDHLWIVGDNVYNFRAPCVDPTAYYYDYVEGQRWIDWYSEYLCHTKGDLKGEPIHLLEWSEICIRELMGWRRKEDGLRRYRVGFMFVPRKNQKTQIGAGLGLGLIQIDEEPSAEVYWAASTEDQAERTCFKTIKDMFDLRPELNDMYDILPSSLTVDHPASHSTLQVISRLPTGKHGYDVSGAILDEYHEHLSDEVRNTLRTGMIGRRQPLLLYITTAGKNKATACYREYSYAKDLLEYRRDNDRYMTFIREPGPEDDPADRKVWAAVNPGIGKSVKWDNLIADWDEALADPSKMDAFLQCQLNMWVEKASGFIPLSYWDMCYENFSLNDLKGRECYGGLDLAQSDDMNAFSLCFPFWEFVTQMNDEGKEELVAEVIYKFLTWYFVPQLAYDESERASHPYSKWKNENLEVTKGNIADYTKIRQRIKQLKDFGFNIKEIGFDPYNATEIITNISDPKGTIKIPCTKVRQGFLTMGAPTQRLKDLALATKLRHNGNAILRWNVQNAKIVKDKADNIMISKLHAAGKVDGLTACANALRLAMDAPPPKKSVYETRGVRTL